MMHYAGVYTICLLMGIVSCGLSWLTDAEYELRWWKPLIVATFWFVGYPVGYAVKAHAQEYKKHVESRAALDSLVDAHTDDDDNCPICMERLREYACAQTPCGHCFHGGCIMGWYNAGHSTCPMCRAPAVQQQT